MSLLLGGSTGVWDPSWGAGRQQLPAGVWVKEARAGAVIVLG